MMMYILVAEVTVSNTFTHDTYKDAFIAGMSETYEGAVAGQKELETHDLLATYTKCIAGYGEAKEVNFYITSAISGYFDFPGLDRCPF
jgi:hypothetical protein